MPRHPRGYTLIEVLVVVTVLGIAGALVIPSMGQAGVLRIQASVRTIVADITFAQSDALAYQRGRAVMFEPDENRYTLVDVTGDDLDPVNDVMYDRFRPGRQYIVDLDDDADFAGARISEVDFDGETNLIFDELGGPVTTPGGTTPSAGGFVEVTGADGQVFRINVEAYTGRVTVQRIAAGG
ncbi:MAG: prepilin-type N-terminal cleavage/methylation domain-containing protein [Phycisphaerales bacterium]|jgi:prepilin-type N-terminal cleavage/methylation domain-containing protein|nr:prepilin-type N-terminal cleavage/methylation domain-containing protein [Phycisphaerales bacterium]